VTKNVPAQKSKDFESSLAALEKIVRDMERGDLPLEESLELFEQGVRLSRVCQERLNEAERRIELLLRDGDGRLLTHQFDESAMNVIDRSVEHDTEEDGSAF
jgi:exodeoxyribonuclease VII small subunit